MSSFCVPPATAWGKRAPGKYGGGGGGNQAGQSDVAPTGNGGNGLVVIEMFGAGSTSSSASGGPPGGFGGAIGTGSLASRLSALQSRVYSLHNQVTGLEGAKSAGGGLIGTKVYYNNGRELSDSYVKTAEVNRVRVVVTGGGGGGGSHNSDDAQGGGGAGATCIKTVDLSAYPVGSKIDVKVGRGGWGSTGNTPSGGEDGQKSSFGSHCVAEGGHRPMTWGIGGKGGTATGGDLNFIGGYGHGGNIDGHGGSEKGGNGGDTLYWKGGGAGATGWGDRRRGNFGGGGGGQMASRRESKENGQGANGMVYVEEYQSSGVAPKFLKTATAPKTWGSNVAVAGTAFGSGSLGSDCSAPGPTNNGARSNGKSCIKNINDGSYGDASRWVANKNDWEGKHFVGVTLKSPIYLAAVGLSRDNKGGSSDRTAGIKTVQYTSAAAPGFRTPHSQWRDLGAVKVGATQDKYATAKLIVTAIRVVVADVGDALDELEIWGTPVHDKPLSTMETIDYIKTESAKVGKEAGKIGSSSGGDGNVGLKSMQVFTTVGTGTWKRPKGITSIKIYVTGGGAGGGSHNHDDAHGGGGAGGTCISLLDVTNKDSQAFTIGDGGLGGTGNRERSGSNGVQSSFGSCIGLGGRTVPAWGIGGAGGGAKGAEILNIIGGYGHSGNIDGYGNSEAGGNGGDSIWGGGGGGASHWGNRRPGRYGGGGGGSHGDQDRRGNSANLGKGGSGIIVVEEYA